MKIVEAGPMWNKDPFLCIKKDVGLLTVQSETIEAGDKEEEEGEEVNAPTIPVAKLRPARKKATKTDLKGKGVALSTEKPKKKPLPKIDEVP